jgi:hypothetical protein
MQKTYDFSISNSTLKDTPKDQVQAFVALEKASEEIPAFLQVNTIKYNHIPNINYFYQDAVKVLNIDLKTVGERIGYIEGAGDKVPAALKQMGYEVLILKEQDVTPAGLKNFDAVMVGVRAYNVVDFMAEKYDVLMDYVK